LRQLVDAILGGTTAPNTWDHILDQFNSEFAVSASCIFSVHEFREASMDFRWSSFYKGRLTPEILEMMQSGGDVDDRPAYTYLFQNAARTFYSELEMFGVETWESLPDSKVRDIVKGFGFVMRTSSALNNTGPWIDGIFCQHETDAEWQSFLKDDRSDFVIPIIGNSISLGRTLQALRSRYQASLAVLDALGLAVFLVDVSGNVIEQNKEAQRILDQQDGFSLTAAKRIKLQSPDKSNELQTMMDNANGLLRGEMKLGASIMASDRPSGAYDYLISVRSLSDGQSELEVGLKCAFVTVIDPAREGALSAEGITAMGQLSGAESSVVDLLVQGLRPVDVAERRDVSVNTIKTQLKVISQKLRCSTQSDIIRVAAATRVPIDKL